MLYGWHNNKGPKKNDFQDILTIRIDPNFLFSFDSYVYWERNHRRHVVFEFDSFNCLVVSQIILWKMMDIGQKSRIIELAIDSLVYNHTDDNHILLKLKRQILSKYQWSFFHKVKYVIHLSFQY